MQSIRAKEITVFSFQGAERYWILRAIPKNQLKVATFLSRNDTKMVWASKDTYSNECA